MKYLLFIILLFGCVSSSQFQSSPTTPINSAPALPAQTSPTPSNVLLITIDGARWQEIFNGTDPVLTNNPQSVRQLIPSIYSRCVDHGMVLGRNSDFIASNPAHISLPGYNEIMHGKITNCTTNECPQTTEPTIIDRLALPDTAVIAGWEEIERAATNNPNKTILNTGRTYRRNWKDIDNQTFPWVVGDRAYRSDPYTGDVADLYIRNHHPWFLWVGFGDTDEQAHAGNYIAYLAALSYVDRWLEVLFYNEAEYMKNTDVLITADHGRGLDWRHHGWDKASEKDWLIMCGKDIPTRGFVGYTEVKSLSNIAPTIEKLMTGQQVSGSLL